MESDKSCALAFQVGVLLTVELVQYTGVTSHTCVLFTSLSRNTLDLVLDLGTPCMHVHQFAVSG